VKNVHIVQKGSIQTCKPCITRCTAW